MAAGSPDDNAQQEQNPANTQALEQRLEALQGMIEKQGDATGQLGQLMQGLQAQLMQQRAPEQDDEGEGEPTEEFKKFYSNPAEYIKKYANEANREAFGPHLAHQAVQTRDALIAQTAHLIDSEHGDGFFRENIQESLAEVFKAVPLEQQASRHHIEAAVGSIMGRLYLNPETRNDMESRRTKAAKAKEEAMNLLPNGRPRPSRGDNLDDSQRNFLDSLRRNGITFTEDQYKAAMKAGNDIDSWRAAKAAAAKK